MYYVQYTDERDILILFISPFLFDVYGTIATKATKHTLSQHSRNEFFSQERRGVVTSN